MDVIATAYVYKLRPNRFLLFRIRTHITIASENTYNIHNAPPGPSNALWHVAEYFSMTTYDLTVCTRPTLFFFPLFSSLFFRLSPPHQPLPYGCCEGYRLVRRIQQTRQKICIEHENWRAACVSINKCASLSLLRSPLHEIVISLLL